MRLLHALERTVVGWPRDIPRRSGELDASFGAH